jgi:N utilization substance protein A
MSREIIEAVQTIEREKGIDEGTLVTALEDALLAAYKKTAGAARHAVVELDDEGEFRVFAIDIPKELEERLLDEARERAIEDLERIEEETGERQHTLINDDDLDLDWSQVPEELIQREDVTPHDFGRIAAQTAKQVILQRIREAERQMMYEEYIDRVGEVVTGIVQQAGDRNNVLVDLGKVESLLPRSEQVDGERYEQGSRIKAVITEVRSGTKGPQVILSRRDPELIKTLFEIEVPEIADGLVEIRGVAREPGYRSKIAVESHAQGVDPVGACVGPRGSRVRMVVSELRGEKIDIIPWNPEPARFVAKALSPARVREVYLDDDAKEATVIVPDDQLALAIGKEGMNARLAARLTGWKIDIQSEREFAQAEAEAAFGGSVEGEEFSGRCAAILANGKRCPNAALPGTRFCGVAAHQELARVEAATGTYAEGSVQPAPEAEEEPGTEAPVRDSGPVAVPTAEAESEAAPHAVAEPEPAGEGQAAPRDEQVAEAVVGPAGEMSPPDEPVTEPDPTPAPQEPEPETGPPVEPTAQRSVHVGGPGEGDSGEPGSSPAPTPEAGPQGEEASQQAQGTVRSGDSRHEDPTESVPREVAEESQPA